MIDNEFIKYNLQRMKNDLYEYFELVPIDNIIYEIIALHHHNFYHLQIYRYIQMNKVYIGDNRWIKQIIDDILSHLSKKLSNDNLYYIRWVKPQKIHLYIVEKKYMHYYVNFLSEKYQNIIRSINTILYEHGYTDFNMKYILMRYLNKIIKRHYFDNNMLVKSAINE